MTTRTVRTGCPYCGVGCGLLAHVEGQRLTAVEGDPLHPVNRGATCRKPLHLADAVHAADRAREPLRRDRPDGQWRACSWEDALHWLAGRLSEIAERYGPQAIGFYLSGQLLTEDYYAAVKLAKGFLGTPNVDSNSRLCMSSAVAGYRGAFGADGPPPAYVDLDLTDCALLLGSNAAACHPIVWARIRRRQQEGATVIVVDPRRTATAAAADLHLPVRPGSDLALLNAMLHVIAREGLVDEAFVASRTAGWEAALDVARAWPPERAAGVCGLEPAAIEQAARRFAGAGRAMAVWSMGANQSTVGTLKNRALINLCLATGNLGRPGCGPLSLTGQPNAMGGREAGGLAGSLPGYRLSSNPADRAAMAALWELPPDAAGIPAAPGLPASDLLDAASDGRIKALWVVGTNPAVSFPDAARARAALGRCELVVVQDAVHPTETSALADLVLPAAQWPEKDGTSTSSERRVTLVRRAKDPPGQARADWEIFAAAARALGFGQWFGWRSADAVHEEYVRATAGRPCDQSGISHLRLRREGSLQWPCPASPGAAHPGTPRLYADRAPCPTPDGRARLAPTPQAPPAEVPDEAFGLLLTSGRVASQWHTMTRTGKTPELRREDPEPFVELNPADAERAGVRDGELVRVRSRRGSASVRARVTSSVPAGVAFAPFHWGALHAPPGAGTLNDLTSSASDPVSRQPELKACAVAIETAATARTPPQTGRGRRVSGGGRRRLLVVGAGPSGVAVVDSLLGRDRARRWDVVVAGREPDVPYDRVALSHVLAGARRPDELALHGEGWFAARGVQLKRDCAVHELDLRTRTARLDDGEQVAWDALVLATGSRPALPAIEGIDRPHVHAFRTLADVRAISTAALPGRRAVVIGGGLLGLEAACGLRQRGLAVTVVHRGDRLMDRQLDHTGARLLLGALARRGIACRLPAVPRAIGEVEVALAHGKEIAADLVVVATGIRPEVELARASGLDVGRGIIVDDELRTSAASTWAVGECAEHRGVVHGLWPAAREQAQVAGAVLAGDPAAFHGSAPTTTLKGAGFGLFCAGRPSAGTDEDEVAWLDTRRGRYRKLVLAGDRLCGAILLGDLRDAPRLGELLRSQRPVAPELLDGAEASGPAADDSGGELVCSCAGVSRGTIERAITLGSLERPEQVSRATGASTGCGGCRGAVAELLSAAAAERAGELATARRR